MKIIITEQQLRSLSEELTQNKQGNFDIIYRDSSLTILVPKTYESCVITTRNTQWCTVHKYMYDQHKEDILFRFFFKDGYKLRLTVIKPGTSMENYHWGKGGTEYLYLWATDFDSFFKPKNEILDHYSTAEQLSEFMYPKDDETKKEYWLMLKRIMSIPKNAQKIVNEYTEKYRQDVSKKQGFSKHDFLTELEKINFYKRVYDIFYDYYSISWREKSQVVTSKVMEKFNKIEKEGLDWLISRFGKDSKSNIGKELNAYIDSISSKAKKASQRDEAQNT